MQRDRFVIARRARWDRLEDLIRRARRRRLKTLSGDELLELGRLYRTATSDLAVARRDFPADRVTDYLNGLVARAHPLVYREPALSVARIGRFFRFGFPSAYREAAPYVVLAFGVFALAALISALLVAYESSIADVLLPGKAQDYRSFMEQHHLWVKSATENHSVASNFIMINNLQVAFLAFAGGLTLGLLTLWAMAANGINLGTVAGMAAHYGLSQQLWSFVVPHGVIELSVIFMAGGAGLMVGDAIVRPGLRSRREALTIAARRGVRLVFGCVPLLVIAGAIEGFYSPSDAPDAAKIAVGAITGLLLYTYVLWSRPTVRRNVYTFALEP